MLELYDVVELREAIPGEELPAGAVGTVVHVFNGPRLRTKSSSLTPMAVRSPWSRSGQTR